jgi:hypothetical protein
MEYWKQGKNYSVGELVIHKGRLFSKDADTDQSEPDEVAGGWSYIPDENNNLIAYQAIEASFSSYEQRVAAHKAEVLAKLQAEGLSPDAVQAVLNA